MEKACAIIVLLTRARRRRVIVIGLFVYVCVCVCVTANLCNGVLLKIHGPCERKNTLSLVRESSDLQENSSMAEILQSKVKKKKR